MLERHDQFKTEVGVNNEEPIDSLTKFYSDSLPMQLNLAYPLRHVT